MDQSSATSHHPDNPSFPVEVTLYVNPDGSVTFADLAAGMLDIAYRLNPDQNLVRDLPDHQVSHEIGTEK